MVVEADSKWQMRANVPDADAIDEVIAVSLGEYLDPCARGSGRQYGRYTLNAIDDSPVIILVSSDLEHGRGIRNRSDSIRRLLFSSFQIPRKRG